MSDTFHTASAPEPANNLLDVEAVAQLCNCSTRHIYRLADSARMPAPVKLGALVRWRPRTGDPATGVLDWFDAGCPSCRRSRRR